jgi:hypothetical protein
MRNKLVTEVLLSVLTCLFALPAPKNIKYFCRFLSYSFSFYCIIIDEEKNNHHIIERLLERK